MLNIGVLATIYPLGAWQHPVWSTRWKFLQPEVCKTWVTQYRDFKGEALKSIPAGFSGLAGVCGPPNAPLSAVACSGLYRQR